MTTRFHKTVVAAVVAGFMLSGCSQLSPEEKAENGYSMLEKNDLRGAEIAFKSALSESPTLTKARIGLVRLAFSRSDYDAAVNELDKVSVSEENRVLVDKLKAYAYHMSENVGIHSIEPHGSPMVLYYQYVETLKVGRDASGLYSELEKLKGGYVELASLMKRANENPTPQLLKEIQTQGYNAESYSVEDAGTGGLEDERLNLGIRVATLVGDLPALTELLSDYHSRHPNDTSRRLEYADALILSGKHDEAENVISPLLARYPENGLLNRMKAIIAYENKDYETVDSAGLLASASNPSDPLPRILMSYANFAKKEYDLALKNLEMVIDNIPASHPSQRLYLQLNAMSGDLANAAVRSLEIDSLTVSDAEMLTSFGMALLNQGDTERARKIAEKVESIGVEGEQAVGLGMLQLSLDDDNAFETLKGAFEADPKSLIAGQSFAAALLQKEKYDDALDLAEQWMSDGRKGESYFLSATVHSLTNETEKAQQYYEMAYAESPESPRVTAGYINSLVAVSEDKKASEVLVAALKRKQYGMYRFYVGAYRNKNGDDGVKMASDTLAAMMGREVASNSQLLLLLSQSYYVGRESEAAYVWLSKIEDAEPSPTYYLLKSALEQELGKKDAALSTYAAWQQSSPENPIPLMGRVRLLIQDNKFDESLAVLDEFLVRVGDGTPASLVRAHVLAMSRRWDDAYDAYINLTSQQQKSPLGKALYGVGLVRQGEFSRAVEALKVLMESSPDNVYLPFYITSLERDGRASDAREYLSRVVEDNPENRYAWFLLANNAAANGLFDMSDNAFSKIVNDEAPSVVLNNYAYVKMKRGELERASEIAERAVAKSPNVPEFVETLASIYVKMGKKKAALVLMDDVIASGVNVNETFMETYESAKQ